MKKTIFLFTLIFGFVYSVNADQTFPEIEGWKLSEETRIFEPDNLFDYINGAAELFFTYGFEKLYVKEYLQGDDMVKVEVYHHANPLNAFGMYSQERYQEGDFLKIGAQGYGGEGYLNFVKDKYYVKIMTYQSPLETLKLIAGKVADNLSGIVEFPRELSYLPQNGRKNASEKFVADNYMGLSFLNNVVTADYQVDDEKFTMFFIENDPEVLKSVIQRYYQFARTPKKTIKEGIHEIKDPYNGNILLKWENNRIVGAVNLDDKKLRKEFLP
jgi:hypothetical protein